ncbi:MAG: tRNA (adenosine(37)-N6)-dimethylallyltransferase MiaA [Thermomicrobiales bacterium]
MASVAHAAARRQHERKRQTLTPDSELPKLIVVTGPTAAGKTTLGVELGLHFDAEVVNADSRYLYRGFNIGTAKPTLEELRGVPHHLIDVLGPTEDFSLARYQEFAYEAIAAILDRGKLPLLVGGTPLYVNAVIEGWKIPRVPPHPEIRARLEREATEFGAPALSARLAEIDPAAAEKCGINTRRIIRALEIHEVTGQPMSSLEGKGPRPYSTLEIGLTTARERLHQLIDSRVDTLFERGLVEEVRGLLESGVPADAPAMSSIGYRQLLPFLSEEQSLAVATQQIKSDTHRYVRHQETWLRSNKRLVPIDSANADWIEQGVNLVTTFISNERMPS